MKPGSPRPRYPSGTETRGEGLPVLGDVKDSVLITVNLIKERRQVADFIKPNNSVRETRNQNGDRKM